MSLGIGLGLALTHGRSEGGGLSLASFMASQADGLWYDTTKTDRFFQDAAGLALADDVGEAMAIGLDQRTWGGQSYAGIVAAATELFPDGGMTDAVTDWTYSNAAGSIVGGALRVTSTFNGTTARVGYKTLTGLTVGAAYLASVDVVGVGGTAGAGSTIKLQALTTGAVAVQDSQQITGTGSRSLIFIATATSHRILVRFDNSSGDTTTYVDFDNLSVKRIPGNHALQATGSLKPLRQSTGAKFDGSDDNWLTPYLASATNNFMVALVTVPASGAVQFIAGANAADFTGRFRIGVDLSTGQVVGGVGSVSNNVLIGGADLRSTEAVIGLSCDGTTIRLFANAAEVVTYAQSGAPQTTEPLRIGACNSGGTAANFFAGSVKKLVAGREALTLAKYQQIRSALLAA